MQRMALLMMVVFSIRYRPPVLVRQLHPHPKASRPLHRLPAAQDEPLNAQVYVDGYFVGVVDEFDGFFQLLRLEEGRLRIEIRHQAYLSLKLKLLIITGETVTYQGDLY